METFENVLRELDVDWELASRAFENIPKEVTCYRSQPPLWGLRRARAWRCFGTSSPDFKLLLNHLLSVFPALEAWSSDRSLW